MHRGQPFAQSQGQHVQTLNNIKSLYNDFLAINSFAHDAITGNKQTIGISAAGFNRHRDLLPKAAGLRSHRTPGMGCRPAWQYRMLGRTIDRI
ncbi:MULTISPECIES: hypothetical protein [Halomonadaceae]|uniref:hypothetical protein n=1 Tax=Halomonadaceae TaxID=28256 RepID=UPI0015826450|nr:MULTISPECIES: hypothetical protein [Halomonas]MDI4638847.1 hypothetical protein [Halomonas sp. BMC7]NUJ59836.1 hypothetical protein [Halomonas taeanensis]